MYRKPVHVLYHNKTESADSLPAGLPNTRIELDKREEELTPLKPEEVEQQGEISSFALIRFAAAN